MNCDEFLEALTSTDERRQTAARLHANTCPACAALAQMDALLKQELAAPDPLSNRLRATWAAAADAPLTRSASEGKLSSRHLPLQLVSLAAALLFLLSGTLLVWQPAKVKDTAELPGIKTDPNSVVAVKTIDASADLSDLLAQIQALEAELNKTTQQAELVDARREADVLLAAYNHW